MSWTAISGTGGSLVVDVPPKVLRRFEDGSPGRSVAISITGTVTVAEVAKAQAQQHLRLRWEYLSSTQVATLRAIVAATGPVFVYLYAGATAIACNFGPGAEQKWEPGIGDDYPEKLADGSAQLAARMWYRVELSLYRTS